LCTLLKRELLFIPIWGWALALLKPIAIDRGNPTVALRKALREGEKKITEDFLVLFFPEGSRQNPGEVGRYARSAFELAKKMNVPVLPLVHNSGDCWPAHRFLKYPGEIKLVIAPPIKDIESSEKAARETEGWASRQLNEIRHKD
tara:strand:- start:738 stop:1172 length:435 start_codon:yes stop_codon:yes gene_type:complete